MGPLRQSRDTEPPGLAVLPFQVLGGATGDGYFADGVAEDITTALGRFRSVRVLAAAPRALRDRPADEAAQELGARYVLRGSLRRAGERLRITAELVDAVEGTHLWAQAFDGAAGDVFEFQDRIAGSVATSIEPQIQAAELGRFRRERPSSVAAYDIFLQARAKLLAASELGNAELYRLITEALALEPENGRMLALAAGAIEHRGAMGWPPFGPDDRERCADFARRGVQHAAGDGTVMAHCGIALVQCVKDYDWGTAVLPLPSRTTRTIWSPWSPSLPGTCIAAASTPPWPSTRARYALTRGIRSRISPIPAWRMRTSSAAITPTRCSRWPVRRAEHELQRDALDVDRC